MGKIEEAIRNRVFCHNKAIGKNEEHPQYVDEDYEVMYAMERLTEALVDIALKDADF
jgi:hypothetical protein